MRIGEIIETGTRGFVGESLELNEPPALGSVVKVEVGDGDSGRRGDVYYSAIGGAISPLEGSLGPSGC